MGESYAFHIYRCLYNIHWHIPKCIVSCFRCRIGAFLLVQCVVSCAAVQNARLHIQLDFWTVATGIQLPAQLCPKSFVSYTPTAMCKMNACRASTIQIQDFGPGMSIVHIGDLHTKSSYFLYNAQKGPTKARHHLLPLPPPGPGGAMGVPRGFKVILSKTTSCWQTCRVMSKVVWQPRMVSLCRSIWFQVASDQSLIGLKASYGLRLDLQVKPSYESTPSFTTLFIKWTLAYWTELFHACRQHVLILYQRADEFCTFCTVRKMFAFDTALQLYNCGW